MRTWAKPKPSLRTRKRRENEMFSDRLEKALREAKADQEQQIKRKVQEEQAELLKGLRK